MERDRRKSAFAQIGRTSTNEGFVPNRTTALRARHWFQLQQHQQHHYSSELHSLRLRELALISGYCRRFVTPLDAVTPIEIDRYMFDRSSTPSQTPYLKFVSSECRPNRTGTVSGSKEALEETDLRSWAMMCSPYRRERCWSLSHRRLNMDACR
jgi:hypothetical protein